VDLGFHHEPLRARFFCQSDSRFVRGFRSVCNFASLDGDAKRLEDAFALIFVDVHAKGVV
jgi:hypothetical protein